MKHIKYFREAISGTELVGSMGPAYGETGLQNKTINQHDTNIILSEIDNGFYTIDEYNNAYGDYLKAGGDPLPEGFNRENLDSVLTFLKKIKN